MYTGEVARLFKVAPDTVRHWDHQGRFPEGSVVWTPGGQRRFVRSEIHKMLNGWVPV